MAKTYLIQRFVLPYGRSTNVIKRHNTFIAISTPSFIFLDMTNFLAPGFSYSKYLAAYKISETKGFFPYEYITDLSKLDETDLPPQTAFYSKLKNTNISDDDYE